MTARLGKAKPIQLTINASCADHSNSAEGSAGDDGLEPQSNRSTDTEEETDTNRNKEDNLNPGERLKSLSDQLKNNDSQDDSDDSLIRASNDLEDSYERLNVNKDSKF